MKAIQGAQMNKPSTSTNTALPNIIHARNVECQ